MKASTREMLLGLVKAAVADKGEREEAMRLLTPKGTERKDKQLTTRQACELAECCPKTLFRWEREGKLHAQRFTRSRVRWSRNEIETALCLEV